MIKKIKNKRLEKKRIYLKCLSDRSRRMTPILK